jgi:hypothetical protein
MAVDKIIQRKKDRFLQCFEETGNISKSAEIAGINRRDHYDWLKNDEKYVDAFAKSAQIAGDSLEAEGFKRALEGWEEPVFYQGEQTATIRKFSDTLLIFLLKGAKPNKYSDRSLHTLQNPDGSAANLVQVIFKDAKNNQS